MTAAVAALAALLTISGPVARPTASTPTDFSRELMQALTPGDTVAETAPVASAPTADPVVGTLSASEAVVDAYEPVSDPKVGGGLAVEDVASVDATEPASPSEDPLVLQEYTVPAQTMTDITNEWIGEILATHPEHTWAPLDFHPSDDQLARLGLPSAEVLRAQSYPEPTMVSPDGTTEVVDLSPIAQPTGNGNGGGSNPPTATQPTGTLGPTVTSVAGAGWMGIRPGALVLLITDNSIGWCSLAHVYGSPGSYQISTAGHCGKGGDVATVIAAFGNRDGVLNPILLDFGTFKTSQDGGLGNDWALISVNSEFQSLVSPTMCFWGGPRGMYTKVGALVGITFPRRGLVPSVTLTPDPTLAQGVAHYGHGTGVGTGGTPRAATAIYWGSNHFMFEGVISPGDSGSGANTLLGDTTGANMEAAGIITHIWVDPLMRDGIGIMGGTRATRVSGTLANGQIVPYPVPAPGLP
ncbi:MAG: hypothetical protein ACRDJI_01285 [Actinomycetota bacterium]